MLLAPRRRRHQLSAAIVKAANNLYKDIYEAHLVRRKLLAHRSGRQTNFGRSLAGGGFGLWRRALARTRL